MCSLYEELCRQSTATKVTKYQDDQEAENATEDWSANGDQVNGCDSLASSVFNLGHVLGIIVDAPFVVRRVDAFSEDLANDIDTILTQQIAIAYCSLFKTQHRISCLISLHETLADN